ncbi:hypothetical protein CHU92_07200 [Flavobacterium cyanobacteriorum]|uniref:Uncharacterized protein n=1 Tax=Flavobacterium cyanobacteriorum TaxID=2022802 RepID=A0A255ZAN4_9FLAO|nr:hypothetical protein [Flavobacterium cyanobacteriorum]OYQ37944.1 hypothetical protein CHU92_07200 [Flavobacterium cyanobacteriorum]
MDLRKILILLLPVMMAACGGGNTTKTGKDIDKGTRDIIKAYNNRLMEGLYKNSNKIVRGLVTDKLNKNFYSHMEPVMALFSRGIIEGKTAIYEEYHTVHASAPANCVITSEKHNFELTYTNRGKQSYVSLITVSDGMDTLLLTVIYELVEDEWKIDNVFAGVLAFYEKDSQYYYNLAKKKAGKGYIIDAFTYADMAEDLLDPANGHIKFGNENKIKLATKIWQAEANECISFPIIVKSAATQPQIAGLAPVRDRDGFCYRITYLTNLPLENKEGLHTEYLEVKKQAEKIKEIDFSGRTIYYTAYTPERSDTMTFTERYK